MKYYNNFSLREYNTFGLDVKAKCFVHVASEDMLREVLNTRPERTFILGGGSNVLLTGAIDAMVLKNAILGREIIEKREAETVVAIGGGENWHDFVQWSIDQGLGGVENLSLIPGTVGAAPIQNIGAYGVELEQVFERLEAVDMQNGQLEVFDHKACAFGYRNSVFKNKLKGRFFITRVFLKLSKAPQLHLSYGAIQKTLAEKGIAAPTIRDVSNAVIEIRQSKLPDPAQLGNSGSFFKNPELEQAVFDPLLQRFPEMVHYPLADGRVKVPAGWLIEQCGFKGKRVGNTGCFEKQALVLVNYGGATGDEIWNFAKKVIAVVKDRFGIQLSPEVNIIS